MKKILFILFCFILLTIVFLFIVLFLNRDEGKGALQITSVPKSRVYLDGDFIGETPICKCQPQQLLPVGEYDIKIVSEQGTFTDFEQRVEINSAVLSVVDRTFGQGSSSSGSIITLSTIPDKNASEILVISFPDKAKIFLDDNEVGETPFLIKNVTASDHEIRLTKDGFSDKTVKIRTVSGFRLETDVYLGINDSALNLSSPSSSPSAQTVSQIQILSTPTGFLRVRSSASASSSEIGQVNPGEKYDLVSQQTDLYEIKLADGAMGWISSQYAQKL